ncbi:hypothetical protein NL676_022460 [Syzygium grande]|nr:hypothetical protein NL676_022460 [Syzygium grande]
MPMSMTMTPMSNNTPQMMPMSTKPMPSETMPKERSSYVGTMPAMKPMSASVTRLMTKMWTMMMPFLVSHSHLLPLFSISPQHCCFSPDTGIAFWMMGDERKRGPYL